MKAIESIIFAGILLCSQPAIAQRLFYCDSIMSTDANVLKGACKYYYNFSTSAIDSVMWSHVDTQYCMIIEIIAPVNPAGKIDGRVTGCAGEQKVFEVDYVSGVAEGSALIFHKGDTLSVTSLKSGRKHGLETVIVYPPTADRYTLNYINGLANGWLRGERNGKLIRLVYYLDGKRHGLDCSYYETGELDSWLYYENGKVKDGTYYAFDMDGQIRETLIIKKGKLKKKIR